MINRVVLCTGGFDPLHSGHIEYLKAAKALGNVLIVGVNSDAWLERKKGRAFMPGVERINIIQNLTSLLFFLITLLVTLFRHIPSTLKHV